jgi:spermidine synthase
VATASLPERLAAALILGIGGLGSFAGRNRPYRFALSLAALLIVGKPTRNVAALVQARSFYGVYRVIDDSAAHMRGFISGTTIHGAEFFTDSGHTPLTYYHRDGPLGTLFSSQIRNSMSRVGVVGLGVGSTAAYARPGETWTFYEIDPIVARIASDTRYFHFLSSASAKPRIVFGDARRSIADEKGETFDLLVIDAFSSDAIPVHLITREALALYRSRLSNEGVIAWHISNRYLDLSPVLAALAKDAGMSVLKIDEHGLPKLAPGRFAADWILMTGSPATVQSLEASGWKPMAAKKVLRLWTDEFSNVLGVVR